MSDFFSGARPGLAVFLNAGDPPLDVLADVVTMLDDTGVDCLELAVPFPGSVTDGPVVRRSAQRALAGGVGFDETLEFVAAVRPQLRRLRIALLADWSHSLRHRAHAEAQVAAAGADGLLVHALPPRVRDAHRSAAAAAGLPIVTTCYASSTADVLADAAAHAGAYLYLVAHYGRSGTAPAAGYAALDGVVAELRAGARRSGRGAPIAVGFGVRTRDDVAAIAACGADAVVVGSAAVARVEHAQISGHDVVAELHDLVRSLHLSPTGS